MVAASLTDGGNPPCADRSWHNAYRAHRIQRAAFEVLAGDVFKRLPAGPEIDAIANLRIASYCGDLGINKMRHKARNRVGSDHRIGIDADEDFFNFNVLKTIIQRVRFARIWLGQNDNLAG